MKEIDISEFSSFARALHCGIRWKIIEYLREGPKSSDEIFKFLVDMAEKVAENMNECNNKCQQKYVKKLKKKSLYYHLRELESVGIIQLAEYKPSEKRKAPEKVWKLNIDKLIINFK